MKDFFPSLPARLPDLTLCNFSITASIDKTVTIHAEVKESWSIIPDREGLELKEVGVELTFDFGQREIKIVLQVCLSTTKKKLEVEV